MSIGLNLPGMAGQASNGSSAGYTFITPVIGFPTTFVTFSRSTTATQVDADGSVSSVGIDVPRVNHHGEC